MIETVQKEFKSTIVDIIDKIQQVQLEMFANANKSVLELYFYIGEMIENNIQWEINLLMNYFYKYYDLGLLLMINIFRPTFTS